ncbi:VWA domain-containing protein [Thalassotalea sp. Y01]|uniref:vWA domain-containing protein n=1 Tax=Thalassotalea sp. Y01 TaxID=2729613 RepID=UPI00145E45EE|nr:VWA domain-containing protein [Thalassotalea sp. Y01]NMP17448.1 VWA domain-containing protein [Thalassotalea sp. Y01]
MIEFAHPLAWLFLPIPVLVYWLLPEYKEQRASVHVPYFARLVKVSGETPKKGAVKLLRRRLQQFLLLLGWVALISAIAQPEWVGEPIEQKKSAREIMVALDLSGSMQEQDFVDQQGQKIDRLSAAKQVLNDFAQQRKHDRLGLILFADAAYLQAPFTDDIATWQDLLNQSQLGYAGYQTAFGDAIGLTIAVFEQQKSKQRVLILLTDGADTGSKMPPIKAAQIAAKHDIKIYTIAVGDPSNKGEYEMDLQTLERVAKVSGGQSFTAINRQELQQAYQQINDLEKQQYETLSYRPKHSLHHLAFAIYFVANLLVIVMLFAVKLIGRKALPMINESDNKPKTEPSTVVKGGQ